MAENVDFPSDDHLLEGVFEDNTGSRGVVITHPHPLYGGNMDNYVVETIARAYHQSGYATLRFNFRGVGRSGGAYDDGIGEQRDVDGALGFLEQRDKTALDLAGYSFGAWVNARMVDNGSIDRQIGGLILVSPPVGMTDGDPSPLNSLQLVITGSHDDIAPAGELENLCTAWNPAARLEIIEGADHFYAAHIGALESILLAHLSQSNG